MTKKGKPNSATNKNSNLKDPKILVNIQNNKYRKIHESCITSFYDTIKDLV